MKAAGQGRKNMSKKGKALVVDDDHFTRNAIKNYLSILGFDVEVAIDGMDGLEKMKTAGELKLIFSDYEMPNMNGLQFLERLKKDPAYQSTPVVILTSVDKQDIIDTAMTLGVTSYMIKPFNNQKMQEVLGKLGLY